VKSLIDSKALVEIERHRRAMTSFLYQVDPASRRITLTGPSGYALDIRGLQDLRATFQRLDTGAGGARDRYYRRGAGVCSGGDVEEHHRRLAGARLTGTPGVHTSHLEPDPRDAPRRRPIVGALNGTWQAPAGDRGGMRHPDRRRIGQNRFLCTKVGLSGQTWRRLATAAYRRVATRPEMLLTGDS